MHTSVLSVTYEVLFSLIILRGNEFKHIPLKVLSLNDMKRSFPYIIIGVLVSLILVFGWQLFWLNGLYNTMEDELNREISKCLESADQADIIIRLNEVEESKENRNYEQSISISGKPDTTGNITFEREERITPKNKDNKEETVIKRELDITNNELMVDQLIQNISFAIHEAIDTICPINLHRVDSLFRDKLSQKEIGAQLFYIEIYNTKEERIIDSTKKLVTEQKTPLSPTLTHFFDTEKSYCYRAYMEPLTGTALIRMGGILITTFLIILILGFAFWYLIRTVLKQKSLEEMKEDFTNNMTHELKTPIAVAYSATDALLNFNKEGSEEKRLKYLQISKDQLTKLSSLVEQILSISMEQRTSFQLHIEEIGVYELFLKLIEQHKLKTERNVSFHLDCNPKELTVHADRTHFTNMISNLIDNAIKYSDSDPEITLTANIDEENFFLSVADKGNGIPPEKQAYIFDKFYRVPRGNLHNVKGYGLGLFYVKTMAEKHGGDITLKSSPDKGTTFTIRIPTKQPMS